MRLSSEGRPHLDQAAGLSVCLTNYSSWFAIFFHIMGGQLEYRKIERSRVQVRKKLAKGRNLRYILEIGCLMDEAGSQSQLPATYTAS